MDVELSDTTIDKVVQSMREMRPGHERNEEKPSKVIKERFLRCRLEIEAIPRTGVLRVVDEELRALREDGKPNDRRKAFLEKVDGRLSLRLEGQGHPTLFEAGLDHTLLSRRPYAPHYPHLTAFYEEVASWAVFYLEPRTSSRASACAPTIRSRRCAESE